MKKLPLFLLALSLAINALAQDSYYPAPQRKETSVTINIGNHFDSESLILGFRRKIDHRKRDDSRQDNVTIIAIQCIEDRMAGIMHNPDCHFRHFKCNSGSASNGKALIEFNVQSKEGFEAEAFRDLCSEVERLRRYGITADELEHSTQSYIRRLRKLQRDNPAAVSIEEIEFCRNFFGKLSVDEVNSIIAREISILNDTYISASGRGSDVCPKCKMPTENQFVAIYKDVCASDIQAEFYHKAAPKLVADEPTPGHIKDIKQNNIIGTTELTLSNGVKVILMSNDNEMDKVCMTAVSNGGKSRYTGDDILNASLADMMVRQMGVGSFTPDEFKLILENSDVDFPGPAIERFSESMSGTSSSESLEMMLQANYLYFTAPRSDQILFATHLKAMRLSLDAQNYDPLSVFENRYRKTLEGKSFGKTHVTEKNIKKINFNDVLRIYNERFANPADFTFYIVGDIDTGNAKTLALIEKWIGGLKTGGDPETVVDDKRYYVKGERRTKFKYRVPNKKASTEVTLTGYDFDYTLANTIKARMLADIVCERLKKADSETAFGTICFFVQGKRNPLPVVQMDIEFKSTAATQPVLLRLVHAVLQNIMVNGIEKSEIEEEQKQLANKYQWSNSNNNIIERLQAYYEAGMNYDRDYLATLNTITPQDIQTFLRSLYTQNNIIEVVMMPK